MTLALRAWVRYLVPLTLLTCLACLPLLYLGLTTRAAVDAAAARTQIRSVWILAGSAIVFQLLAVAAVAPAVRCVASRAPLAQWRILLAGLHNLVRGVLPWIVAITAVVLGGVALVIPGVLLLVLVSLTGASDELGTSPQAATADSIAVARTRFPRIALLVLAIVVVNLAITFAAQTLLVSALAKKVAAAKLLPIRTFVRVTVIALVAFSSLAACALAGAYSDAKRR